MPEIQSDTSVLWELVSFLIAELRDARKQRVSAEDMVLLQDLLNRARHTARKLERLDAQTPS